ncbi:MAG: type II secretion system protein [Cyanobacteria bacterium SIG30]|nr:type II secretion system protein [Cyanobacteria bacterium SIG30]
MYRFNFNHGGGASSRLKAFTLAEVLITLAIIGVVAALTIPSVVTNYQNQETATRLKKTFSTLANTTNLAIKDHGPISGWNIPDEMSGAISKKFADDYIIPYLKISKNCGISIDGDCGHTFSFHQTSGALKPYTLSGSYTTFYLADGTFLALKVNSGESSNGVQKNASIYVDINGKKKPNILGKDAFIISYGLILAGKDVGGKFSLSCGRNEDGQCTIPESIAGQYGCNSKGSGASCSYLIMANGWKVPSKEEYVNMGGDVNLYPW